MSWDRLGQPRGRTLHTWRTIQLWVGLLLFGTWTLGAVRVGLGTIFEPFELGILLLSLALGLFSLHWITRSRKKALNEWLGMLVFLVASMVLPVTIEAVGRFAIFAGWVNIEPPSSSLSAVAGDFLGTLIIPGVGALWAYYGISRYGIADQPSDEAGSE